MSCSASAASSLTGVGYAFTFTFAAKLVFSGKETEMLPSASVTYSAFSKAITPSVFDTGYSTVRLKFSAGVPSALETEKTKGAAKALPELTAFGEETVFTVVPSRDSKKSSSGVFWTVITAFGADLSCVERFSLDDSAGLDAQAERRSTAKVPVKICVVFFMLVFFHSLSF